MNASFVPMTLFLFHYQLLVYFQIPSAVPGFILVMITSTEGGLWVNPTIGLMSKSLGFLVVVKVYLCMRDAKNKNNSVNAKDLPRQSLLPGKNNNILIYFSKILMFENIDIYFYSRKYLIPTELQIDSKSASEESQVCIAISGLYISLSGLSWCYLKVTGPLWKKILIEKNLFYDNILKITILLKKFWFSKYYHRINFFLSTFFSTVVRSPLDNIMKDHSSLCRD